MQYNRLGKAGIKVSEVSFGSWVTFSKQIGKAEVKQLMCEAYDQGVNFFDNAEAYAKGEAEELMGEALQSFRRESVVVSTKLFFGGDTPNEHETLSRKHLLEGINNSLRRLQLDYVDLLFCHRPDVNTPIEETVRAMDHIIREGKALYWGTSMWTPQQLEETYQIAKQTNCYPPSMEQPQYNMLCRHNVEVNLAPFCQTQGLGLTIWSPLASGVLTGKYNDNIPENSRLANEAWLIPSDMQTCITIVKKLMVIAQNLDCSIAQLALAWCLKNPHVSTVITGATSMEQLQDNLLAISIKEKITPGIIVDINNVLAGYSEQ